MSTCSFSILTLNLVLTEEIPPHVRSGVQSRLYRVTQLRTDGVHCRESVVSKHNHCCTAGVHIVDPFFPPDLCLYKRRKFSVHGTISYVVFHNIPIVNTAVL